MIAGKMITIRRFLIRLGIAKVPLGRACLDLFSRHCNSRKIFIVLFFSAILTLIFREEVTSLIFGGVKILDIQLVSEGSAAGDRCHAGHIDGFKPVCGPACLPNVSSGSIKFPHPVSVRTRFKIKQIPGWMEDVHYDVVARLTEMQWRLRIYGTVGEIGVFFGKFFTVLALNSDRSREKLFAADIFDKKSLLMDSVGTGDLPSFFNNLGELQISRDDIHVWKDSSLYLEKYILKKMGLHKFRMLSIDGAKLDYIVLNDLRLASCVMRSGGIVMVNDVTHADFPGVAGGLRMYFKVYGEDVLTPLLLIGNKIYLVAGKSHAAQYLEYIESTLGTSQNLKAVVGGDIARKLGLSQDTRFFMPS